MKYDAEIILQAAKPYAARIGVLGGGGSLNHMIMQAVRTGDAGPDIRRKFTDRAEELVREGVSGFGEMAAEHFAGATGYEEEGGPTRWQEVVTILNQLPAATHIFSRTGA